jgi:hypothetical protein
MVMGLFCTFAEKDSLSFLRFFFRFLGIVLNQLRAKPGPAAGADSIPAVWRCQNGFEGVISDPNKVWLCHRDPQYCEERQPRRDSPDDDKPASGLTFGRSRKGAANGRILSCLQR